MKAIFKYIYKFFYIISRAFYKFIIMPVKKSQFAQCGRNVHVGEGSSITFFNTFIGNNVSIGSNAVFMSSIAKIKIGNSVMFGPNVFMITGDHRIDVVGKYMAELNDSDKLPENDKDIVIEDDVWIGANAIILKGVTIGEGSIIAAGSVVTKNVEPYSIYAGVPAKKIKDRFSEEKLSEHKRLLGEQR